VKGIKKVSSLWRDPRSAGSDLPVDQPPLRFSGSTPGKCCGEPLLFGAMCSQGFV
jgi:hypothetical protein